MNAVKREIKQLNPIRRIMNYIVAPIYGALFAAAIIIWACLMAVDENKYTAVFLSLTGFALLLTVAMLASIPFVRKKEAVPEAAKYDFDFESVEKKESYTFERRILVGTAEIKFSPFEKLTDGVISVTGNATLEKALSRLHADEIVPAQTFDGYPDMFAGDMTADCGLTDYEIAPRDGKLEIYEKSCISFSKDGAVVNGKNFHFDGFTATVNSICVSNRAELSVIFEFGENFCATAKLDKNIIAILKQFDIKITNGGALDALLNDKLKTFEQVLKYGKIKKY